MSPEEIQVLEALAERIIPSDDGPGAAETGVINYLCQELAHPANQSRAGIVHHGLVFLEAKAQECFNKDFAACNSGERDRVIAALGADPHPLARSFLGQFIGLCLEGFLCEPHQGGNRNRQGWDYVGHAQEGAES